MTKPSVSEHGFTQPGFGFRKIDADSRTRLVEEVFASVAPKYDLMNDLMSMGVHRLWKRDFIRHAAPRPGEAILDLAGGTGDIAMGLVKNLRAQGVAEGGTPLVTVCDLSPAMLDVGKARAADRGFFGAIGWKQGNAEDLPFADKSFDLVTICFGLRNVTHIGRALAEAFRVLKPGGRFHCLEFSRPALPLFERAYDRYSFSFLPWLGEKVAQDRESYQYLAESIRAFPPQEKLAGLMAAAGFDPVRWRNVSLGLAAMHWGCRP